MWVSHLSLREFRNHRATDLALTPGVTVFVGSNGQGKTNLVEALGYLSNLSSHRVSSDKALVKEGQPTATVRAIVRHNSRSVDLALALNAHGANKAKLNGQNVGVGELLGWLRVVLFTPEDLSIVRGEPAVRRKFLDEAVAQLIPRMHSVFSEFDRLLKQRNALLKSARGMNRDALIQNLESWNDTFVSLASDITFARVEVLALITPHIATAYNTIAPGHSVQVNLDGHGELPVTVEGLREHYREELTRRQRDEMDRGMTLVGPHRDDLSITLNGLPSRTHSSHGEAWSLALSLRLAVAQCYRDESTSGDPVMILDDVFAELDASRRLTLQRIVSEYEQVLVTAAVREDIPEGFSTQWFHVEAGVVSEDAESLPSAP